MRNFISILFVFWMASLLFAETPKASLQIFSAGESLAISSDKMTLNAQEDKVLFEGNVAIQKGDMKMTAGRVQVLLADKEKGASKNPSKNHSKMSADLPTDEGKEIVEIAMTEKVDIKQGDRHVLAQKGVYNTKRGEIVLTGEAEMWEKGYHVKGRLIRLSLNQKKSFVEGSVLTIY